jgi:hypothetical protein
MEISSTIVGMFMDSLIDPDDTAEFPTTSGNNRVVMKMGKRYMEYYDLTLGVMPYHKPYEFVPPTLKNHYEKIAVKEPFYFYVKKEEPSDITGSLLVSNDEMTKLGIDPDYPDGREP